MTACSATLMLLQKVDLGDGDPAGNRRVEIDVVRTDPGGEGQLQIRRFGDPLRSQICRPKRLGDHDIGVGQFTFEFRVRAFLVGRHDELVAAAFEEFAQTPARQTRSPAVHRE